MPEMVYSINNDDEVGYKEELHFHEERLAVVLEGVKLKFDVVFELLNLNNSYQKLNGDLSKYKGKFGHLESYSFTDDFYSPVLDILSKYLDALTSHIDIDNEDEYATINLFTLLERIIQGTPKILSDSGIAPSNEAEVRKKVYNTLLHVFPDTVREIPISKVYKVYKPDIGIRGLKAAIEYKFVNSEKDAKTAIGGIFEDINGYAGSSDWKTFYAVIYMTEPFLTQHQVEAEFKISNVPHNWKPIVLNGNGRRKSKTNYNKK